MAKGTSSREARCRQRGRGSSTCAEHRLPGGTRVALETGTVAFFVARQLAALGLAPDVIDAHEVRLKAHRPNQKSDRRDALELCEGLRRDMYRAIVHVPRLIGIFSEVFAWVS